MKNISKKMIIRLFQTMLKIRLVEEKIIGLYPAQEIRCPVHLCIGQEAVAAGVNVNLKKGDFVFSNHRGHGHYIAKGGSLTSFMAELYGKQDGCSKGKGGSMHLVDKENGFMGTTAIVAAGIPLAVGSALAFVMQKQKNISVVFFGDGAVDEGTFAESLNFAALKKLPVLFVCENNFYAANSHQSARQSLDNIYKKGLIYGIKGKRIDGNDVIKIFETSKDLIEQIRKGKGPALLECRTYRWKAHVGPDYDFETGFRPKRELEVWTKTCPINRLAKKISKEKILVKSDIEEMQRRIKEEIDEAVIFAKTSPFPGKGKLLEDVY